MCTPASECRRDHLLQHLDRVVLDRGAGSSGRSSPMRLSSAPTPGACTSMPMKSVLRQRRGDLRGGIAHAEADLQHRGRVAAEDGRRSPAAALRRAARSAGRVRPARAAGPGPCARRAARSCGSARGGAWRVGLHRRRRRRQVRGAGRRQPGGQVELARDSKRVPPKPLPDSLPRATKSSLLRSPVAKLIDLPRHRQGRHRHRHHEHRFAEARHAALGIADAAGEILAAQFEVECHAVEIDRRVVRVLHPQLHRHAHLHALAGQRFDAGQRDLQRVAARAVPAQPASAAAHDSQTSSSLRMICRRAKLRIDASLARRPSAKLAAARV